MGKPSRKICFPTLKLPVNYEETFSLLSSILFSHSRSNTLQIYGLEINKFIFGIYLALSSCTLQAYADTWQLRHHSMDQWDLGRLAAVAGTTQICLKDLKKIKSY